MKQYLVAVIIYTITYSGSCQINMLDTSNYSKIIKEQAEIMSKYLLERNFKSFINFTYPKIIEIMGGEEVMIEILEENSKLMEAQGNQFLKVNIGESSKVISIQNELQCTVPQTLELKIPTGKAIIKSTLIAISTNNGIGWYFIDTSGKDIHTIRMALPNLSEELIIPQKEKPILIND